jgi:uncharacterized membrane protein YgcG
MTLRLVVMAVSATLILEPVAFAQQSAPPASKPAAAAAAPAADGKTFSQQSLDELLAPIALYPDALLAQILMASTYPLEIVEAARWQKANASLKDKALEDALQQQTWDPSVKSLTVVPQVLTMMNEKLDWTTKLGDAFLAQQEDVLKTAQSLRAKAQQAGTLKSTKEQTVKQEVENNTTVIKIEQADPQVVNVPVYNPATAYGPWWYSYPPPYYYYPPAYPYAGTGLAFATGVVVGAAIWGNVGWGNNNVNVNVNKYNNFNKTNVSNGNWNHNAEHRKGAAYRDSGTAQKYGKGSDRAASQSRDQFRGRAEQGRSEMSSMDRSQLQAADRSAGQQRASGASDRSAGGGGSRGASASTQSRGGGSGGFSGAGGGGASTRAASSRGSSSMSRGGGGGGRGGGRR